MTYEKALEVLHGLRPRGGIIPQARAEMIDIADTAIRKQIPVKPYKDNENGVYEKDYCPTCYRSLFPNDHHCRCGQAIDWSDENESETGT